MVSETARERRRKARRCARNPRLPECQIQKEENDVITRDFDIETTSAPADPNLVTEVFNGIIPVTEIGTYTKPPRRTLSTSTTIPTTMITNLTLASPAEIVVPANPQPRAMDGWMVLVGIIAGTIILVTLVWNTVKLWCRKIERDSMRRPGVIAYLTEDEAITTQGHGRLAEPGNVAQAAPGEIMLTNSQLNRLIVAGESQSNYQMRTGTPVRPNTPEGRNGDGNLGTYPRESPQPTAPLSPTFTTTSNLPAPPPYSEINPHPTPLDPSPPQEAQENNDPNDSDSSSGEINEPNESRTTNL
ncbi:Oidioi.mRNA.OKI2018_I69.chr2.g4153.t2.cds [Oikopleura dioica]|uniref:Oidioi.mRNA.OKI2018_I69.chr2.g4153.t2.cds n=1 Tax=Oikopleura dioica TaxID=34765 RepID=A0ABN7T0N2_OIKDI|nr:Oidioi.mRNA.OKI2018_I69.chr2.g4153.t2.cds [Oikopleura dioica]